MSPRRHGIRRKRVECPECGAKRTITWRSGVRYFRAKRYACPSADCEFIGARGQWPGRFEL